VSFPVASDQTAQQNDDGDEINNYADAVDKADNRHVQRRFLHRCQRAISYLQRILFFILGINYFKMLIAVMSWADPQSFQNRPADQPGAAKISRTFVAEKLF
jgi:hypothetical protein